MRQSENSEAPYVFYSRTNLPLLALQRVGGDLDRRHRRTVCGETKIIRPEARNMLEERKEQVIV